MALVLKLNLELVKIHLYLQNKVPSFSIYVTTTGEDYAVGNASVRRAVHQAASHEVATVYVIHDV